MNDGPAGGSARCRGFAFLALLCVAPVPALRAEEGHDRAFLVRRALDELHSERFEAALATAQELRLRFPDDPAGALSAANVYQTMMRDYRLLDQEGKFRAELQEAQRLAEARVRSRPDAEAFFARATARGYVAVHDSRCGRWFSALRQGLRCLGDMKRAAELDPDFVDPLLSMALYDYWKSRKLNLGLGFFRGLRPRAVTRLETVWQRGRYLSVEAAYGLVAVHVLEGRFERALEANDWLHERFPNSPVCLYYRALILEGLGRPAEAVLLWDRLVARLLDSGRMSHGFLAECHLHRAKLLASLSSEGAPRLEDASAALRLALDHARRRDPRSEMEGPFESFEAVREELARFQRRFAVVPTGRTARR